MKTVTIRTAALIILMALGQTAWAVEVQHTIRIDGISCPFCVMTSEKALSQIAGITRTKSDLKAGTITVCADETIVLTDAQLTKIFEKKGFTYKGMETTKPCKL